MNDNTKTHIVIGVSTLGRSKLIFEQIEDLSRQTDLDFTLGVCDQSSGELSAYRRLLDNAPFKSFFVEWPPTGASAGRNRIVDASPESTTHFLFPNDTSRFNIDFISQVKAQCLDQDLIVLTYLDSGSPRYKFEPGEQPLDRRNVWKAIEPAMVLAKELMKATEGFDESLGTGTKGPFRSGEGTDLLLRSLDSNVRVKWCPEIIVFGVPQSHGITFAENLRKNYFYGRGYGYLLSKYSYDAISKARAVVGPFLNKQNLRSGPKGMLLAFASSSGRAISILGHCFKAKSPQGGA